MSFFRLVVDRPGPQEPEANVSRYQLLFCEKSNNFELCPTDYDVLTLKNVSYVSTTAIGLH